MEEMAEQREVGLATMRAGMDRATGRKYLCMADHGLTQKLYLIRAARVRGGMTWVPPKVLRKL